LTVEEARLILRNCNDQQLAYAFDKAYDLDPSTLRPQDRDALWRELSVDSELVRDWLLSATREDRDRVDQCVQKIVDNRYVSARSLIDDAYDPKRRFWETARQVLLVILAVALLVAISLGGGFDREAWKDDPTVTQSLAGGE
jgi:hypothetical protein